MPGQTDPIRVGDIEDRSPSKVDAHNLCRPVHDRESRTVGGSLHADNRSGLGIAEVGIEVSVELSCVERNLGDVVDAGAFDRREIACNEETISSNSQLRDPKVQVLHNPVSVDQTRIQIDESDSVSNALHTIGTVDVLEASRHDHRVWSGSRSERKDFIVDVEIRTCK